MIDDEYEENNEKIMADENYYCMWPNSLKGILKEFLMIMGVSIVIFIIWYFIADLFFI